MDYRKKVRLGDILVQKGIIDANQLVAALARQKEKGGMLGEVLVEIGYVNQDILNGILCEHLHIDFVDIRTLEIDERFSHMLDEKTMRKYTLVPIGYDKNNMGALKVAMADPMNILAMDDINIITGKQVVPLLANPRDIKAFLDKLFGKQQAQNIANLYKKEQGSDEDNDEERARKEDIESAPIVQLVNNLLEQAVRQRASDIHIEPFERAIRIRYRVDGSLYEVISYDYSLLSAIVARIKIISGMDISEKRKPQDGRITTYVDNREYDIRVSILPTVYGEKIVMRLTSKTALTKEKKDLGLSESELKIFDHILSNPHGILLVTGPTGSGKSTTLYTALSELNSSEVNIITVEDPVEANIDGINQIQVNNKADLTFASALRSILRQDPDIIMIGEIRDTETASIAVQASITGHLVVSTLHTNSAASTVTRLEDMGIEPYLIADSTVGIIAQRLVRRLCPNCKKEREPDAEERELLQITTDEQVTIYEPCGCKMCDNTGFRGRIGVYEIMEITHDLKNVIARGGNADDIKNFALNEGMHTLRMSATKYVLEGITSVTEMKKVSFDA